MPMLFGSALSFTTFVLVVVVAQVSTLFISSVLLYIWALGLVVRFRARLANSRLVVLSGPRCNKFVNRLFKFLVFCL